MGFLEHNNIRNHRNLFFFNLPLSVPGMRIRLGGCGSGVRGPGYSHKGWGGGEGVSVFWSAERHVGCGVG